MTIYKQIGFKTSELEQIEVADPFTWLIEQAQTAPTIDEKARAVNIISGTIQDNNGVIKRNNDSLINRDIIMLDYEFNNLPQDNFNITHDDFKREVTTKLESLNLNYLIYPTFSADADKVRYRVVVPTERPMKEDTYKVTAWQLAKLINLPIDKTCIATWSQLQGAPVKSPTNKEIEPVYRTTGNKLTLPTRVAVDSLKPSLNEYLGHTTKGEQPQIKLTDDLALEIVRDYTATEGSALHDYTNSLTAILVLAKAVINKEISQDTAIESVKIIADGNIEWEKGNVKKLKEAIKKGKIKTDYNFTDKFIRAVGLQEKYKHLLNKDQLTIRDEISIADLSAYTINNIPREWLQHLTDEEKAILHKNTSVSNQLDRFLNEINTKRYKNKISTGFNALDNLLDGGLYTGLYFIGAISSLGKTTFLLQMADNIAKQGEDVLIFSLEMSRQQIMSKSLSRLTYELAGERASYITTDGRYTTHYNARTVRQITDTTRYSAYTDYQKELITEAVEEYRKYASNVYIHEGVGDIGVNHVKEAVEIHKKVTGKTPIVIIDYLQILAPLNDRGTDKQNTDKAVVELKRLSRDYDTPVIAISSLNRDNYSKAISMLAFKESGAIEYSSDVLIGLQFKAQREADQKNKGKAENNKEYIKIDHEEEKNKTPREIELKLLKQRDGVASGSVDFNYYAPFNYFEEVGTFKKQPGRTKTII